MVYLLHLSAPLGSDRHQAQHYLGWAQDVEARLAMHRAGRGARMLAVAVERGITFEVARLWLGDRAIERQLKQMGHARRLCPVCSGAAAWRRGIVTPPPTQLTLPWDDEFPDPPSLPMDGWELWVLRQWRAATPTPEPVSALLDMEVW